MNKCQYPDCHETEAGTFALVPLCEDHLIDVNIETKKYYTTRKAQRSMRVMYQQIEHLIPWSQYNLQKRGVAK